MNFPEDFSFSNLSFTLGSLVVAVPVLYVIKVLYKKYQIKKQYRKFENGPKDHVILHAFHRLGAPFIKTAVPSDTKVQVFLRMAKIDYELEYEYPWGPKGKTPWITFNGHHVADSHFIIEFLKKKLSLADLNGNYSKTELATARAVRIMLEERWYWAIALWRMVWDDGQESFNKVFGPLASKLPFYLPLWAFKRFFRRVLLTQAWYHGVGRHSKEEIISVMTEDLRTVSTILGTNKFILGDEPCEEDPAIFAQIAQAVWALPDSPYEKLINAELLNLRAYCYRMVDRFCPDWTE